MWHFPSWWPGLNWQRMQRALAWPAESAWQRELARGALSTRTFVQTIPHHTTRIQQGTLPVHQVHPFGQLWIKTCAIRNWWEARKTLEELAAVTSASLTSSLSHCLGSARVWSGWMIHLKVGTHFGHKEYSHTWQQPKIHGHPIFTVSAIQSQFFTGQKAWSVRTDEHLTRAFQRLAPAKEASVRGFSTYRIPAHTC